ncbi:MAG: MoaD/ThiS family protein [Bacillota bacterium]
MITVTVNLKIPWMPCEQRQMMLEEGATLRDMLRKAGIDQNQWSELLLVANGKNRLPEDDLADGDSIVVLPLLCGG